MQVKKYIATDMPEAIKKIKEDLGPRAIIISTKKVRKGSGAFGMFGKPVLEVTAAKDEKKKKVDPAQYDGLLKKQKLTPYQQEIQNNPPRTPEKPPPSLPPRQSTGSNTRQINSLQEDISELKDLVMDLRRGVKREVNDNANISHLRYDLRELKGLVNSLITQSSELRAGNLHENLVVLFQQLCFNGVEEKFVKRLVEEVQKKLPEEEMDNFSYVKIYLARMFMQILKVAENKTTKESKWGPRVLTFIGPTGVGKTTTLAKIAGREKLNNPNLKIGLITLDTYRIAAVQQLTEYARILKVPIMVVNDTEQLDNALKEYRDKDLVLIDTAGRSQRDEFQMAELREFLKRNTEFANLLVLSSTTKDSDLIEITKRFGMMQLSGIIFTKLDEATNYGSIFNHSIRFKLPLYFLTTGQNVPEDIEDASKERLIDLLMNISDETD